MVYPLVPFISFPNLSSEKLICSVDGAIIFLLWISCQAPSIKLQQIHTPSRFFCHSLFKPQFLREKEYESEEVVTPLMLDGTYLSRNIATLGPFGEPDSRRLESQSISVHS